MLGYFSQGSNTSTTAPADCTFETINICGYIQDKTDVFDWSFQSGGTATTGTGPTNDHTYGTASGMLAC
ncbi:hypothetical protein DPMN_011695 [Dreissena polymorpha]|uniref:MAM domain-containing protein n=1 Tax=Dreissena polymorpha TaxID=45954 RepID=A0A9D4N115_DREPO|nr:hypothetical protein DPMN_011695 [Dreissena polymorpha]